MPADLTILIPNYNRPLELSRLLRSVFNSIDVARACNKVEVLVVDDFSSQDMSSAIRPYLGKKGFRFTTQRCKCGNAELAFLSALVDVESEFVWLLGNDDQLLDNSVMDVMAAISKDVSFMLLNPILACSDPSVYITPVTTSVPFVYYNKCEDLFYDFGFVTSTTTFPCLVMKVKPIRDFHEIYRLTDYSNVYSHSFSLFCAFRESSAMFLAKPTVLFSLNNLEDEKSKLEAQVLGRPQYFHQSLGLARLMVAASDASKASLRKIGWSQEDEFSKSTYHVSSTYLCFFLTRFTLEQLQSEQTSSYIESGFNRLVDHELDEIEDVLAKTGAFKLQSIIKRARMCLASRWRSSANKVRLLQDAQERTRDLLAATRKTKKKKQTDFHYSKVVALGFETALISRHG